MSDSKYCPKCGNTGVDIDGNPCECKFNVQSFYETVSCLDIPEQYRGVLFSTVLVRKDIDASYASYLQSIYDSITAMRWKFHNLCLCSPIGHSKTILAYSCIENLFRHGIATFPVFDVIEIKRILLDMDLCRKQLYEVEKPEMLIKAPILFVKIPRIPTWEVYDTISVILDRRVRRGNSTIFLYDGYWEQLIKYDKQNVLIGLLGDGTYNTLEPKTWYVNKPETGDPEIQLEDNIG